MQPASSTRGPTRTGLEIGVTVVPVSVVKGLELDGVVVVEPAKIVDEEQQGLRALYVALTRSTRRLTIVHADRIARGYAAVRYACNQCSEVSVDLVGRPRSR